MIVFTYGCRAPKARHDEMLETLRLAHKYRNALVELKQNAAVISYCAGVLQDDTLRDSLKPMRLAEDRALRAACGLHYGTYLLASDSAKKALRFARWTGEGRIGCPLNNGSKLSVQRALDCDQNTLHLQHVRGLYYIARLRQGSGWFEWEFKMHRPLPADGVILKAWVQRRMIATDEKWELQLVLSSTAQRPRAQLPFGLAPTGRTVGLDLGWRRVAADGSDFTAGLRVAALSTGEIHSVPRRLLDRYEHARSIEGIRQRHFDEHKPHAGMRSPNRLSRCVRAGEFPDLPELEQWRKQDRHLHTWHEHQERNVRLARREHYRLLAVDLCNRFDTIFIEDFDLRRIARQKIAGDQRFDTAPSEYRRELLMIAASRGVRVIKVPAEYTTLTCFHCDFSAPWARKNEVQHTCEGCSAVFDADVNAAQNINARGLELEALAGAAAAE